MIYTLEQGVDFEEFGDERFLEFCRSVNKKPEDLIPITAEQKEQLALTLDEDQMIWDFEKGEVVKRVASEYEKIDNAYMQYETDLQTIKDALLTAILADDQDLIEELKQEYKSVVNEYKSLTV